MGQFLPLQLGLQSETRDNNQTKCFYASIVESDHCQAPITHPTVQTPNVAPAFPQLSVTPPEKTTGWTLKNDQWSVSSNHKIIRILFSKGLFSGCHVTYPRWLSTHHPLHWTFRIRPGLPVQRFDFGEGPDLQIHLDTLALAAKTQQVCHTSMLRPPSQLTYPTSCKYFSGARNCAKNRTVTESKA